MNWTKRSFTLVRPLGAFARAIKSGPAARANALIAAALFLASGISQRIGWFQMQPFVVSGALTPYEASSVAASFGCLAYWVTAWMGYAHHDSRTLRAADPGRGFREWALPKMERVIPGIVVFDQRFRWIGTVVSYAVSILVSAYLSQVYLARLPAATGGSITALGAVGYGIAVRWRKSGKAPRLALPLLAVTGIAAMIPWGDGLDVIGLAAAIGGALCSAAMVRSAQRLNVAGILIKGKGICQLVALGTGLPMIFEIGKRWNSGMAIHGLIAGLVALLGTILYNTALSGFKLSADMEGFLVSSGPVLSGAVAFFALNQTLSLVSIVGMLTVVTSLFLLALQRSREDARRSKGSGT